ncbi:MAG TPA: TetR family transcriptional regulator [Galbitalea sp.]|nr:TetR family transcriptional regulator [Galbitalea sp.]
MRTAERGPGSSSIEDFTARARIRDAAIDCFAASGFDATVREIAARAGVSPGLITHHFGSKDALREECDAEALRRVFAIKVEGARRSPREQVAMIAELDDFGPTFGYILRSVRDGGEAGRAFLRGMIDDAMIYVSEAVESGVLLPSVDPRARVELLITQSIGGMIMQLTLDGEVDYSDGAALIRHISGSTSLVQVELYTQGLLADRTLLDEYLRQVHTSDPTEQKDRTEQ